MSTAHLYIFSDACPSDWLVDGHDNVWHTIVNVGFQSAPRLQDQIESGASPNAVLEQDPQWVEMIEALRSGLPFGELKKWKTSPRYKARFCSSFTATWPSHRPLVSACSFQEKTLRECESVLLKAYNEHIGGLEGRGIGFERSTIRRADDASATVTWT